MTAPHTQCQPDTTGHNEAEGHAASLLQQAIWIEESVDGTVPPSQRIDLGDVDIDELRSAAQFIAQQAALVEELTAEKLELANHIDGCVKVAADALRRVEELTGLARFLLDRLAEFDPNDYDAARDFHGHVCPAIARLASALSLEQGGGGK